MATFATPPADIHPGDNPGLDPRLGVAAAAFANSRHQMLIDGHFVPSASGKTFPVYNPANGEVICEVPEGDSQDVDKAVHAARRAFDSGPWHTMSPSGRGQLLWKLADLLEKHTDEFAELESLDNGKPVSVARVADVPLAVDLFRYMAGWATKIAGQRRSRISAGNKRTQYLSLHASASRWAWWHRSSRGTFPLLMAAWKLGPALATGCTVILKPAEQTPLSGVDAGGIEYGRGGIPRTA